MKSPCELSNVEEIVMYASSLNEGTLARRDEFVDDRRKAQGEDFCDYFRNPVDEANGPEVPD
jgi:hypothetical protein